MSDGQLNFLAVICVFLLSQWLITDSPDSYLSPLACCGCSAFFNATEESSALGDLDILDIKSQDKLDLSDPMTCRHNFPVSQQHPETIAIVARTILSRSV